MSDTYDFDPDPDDAYGCEDSPRAYRRTPSVPSAMVTRAYDITREKLKEKAKTYSPKYYDNNTGLSK